MKTFAMILLTLFAFSAVAADPVAPAKAPVTKTAPKAKKAKTHKAKKVAPAPVVPAPAKK